MSEDIKFDLAAERLKAIAHPKRMKIISYLNENGESNISTIQSIMGLPQPTLSQHLSKLQKSGLLIRKKIRTEVFYSLEQNELIDSINKICKLSLD